MGHTDWSRVALGFGIAALFALFTGLHAGGGVGLEALQVASVFGVMLAGMAGIGWVLAGPGFAAALTAGLSFCGTVGIWFGP